MVKNPPASTGGSVSIPGWGRSPGGGNGYPTPVFLPSKSPWTEETVGLQSMGSHRVGYVTPHARIHERVANPRRICSVLSPAVIQGVAGWPSLKTGQAADLPPGRDSLEKPDAVKG